MSENIHISLHQSNNLNAFNQYNKAYSKVIQEFGEKYSIFSENWYLRPNTYCCIMSNAKQEAMGGYRFQIHQPHYNLPIQNKSTKYQDSIESFIRNQNYFKLCEASGFFVLPEYRKSIISYEVARSILVLIVLLDVRTMLGIALEQSTKILNHFDLVENKKIMSPDNYFLFANNPKSFIFEMYNLTEQIKKGIEKRDDAHILTGMLEQKFFSYKLDHGQKKYEFHFENHMD